MLVSPSSNPRHSFQEASPRVLLCDVAGSVAGGRKSPPTSACSSDAASTVQPAAERSVGRSDSAERNGSSTADIVSGGGRMLCDHKVSAAPATPGDSVNQLWLAVGY